MINLYSGIEFFTATRNPTQQIENFVELEAIERDNAAKITRLAEAWGETEDQVWSHFANGYKQIISKEEADEIEEMIGEEIEEIECETNGYAKPCPCCGLKPVINFDNGLWHPYCPLLLSNTFSVLYHPCLNANHIIFYFYHK